jgi:hypothetical protein
MFEARRAKASRYRLLSRGGGGPTPALKSKNIRLKNDFGGQKEEF